MASIFHSRFKFTVQIITDYYSVQQTEKSDLENMIRAKISIPISTTCYMASLCGQSAMFVLMSAIPCVPYRLLARKDKASTPLLFDSLVENPVQK